MGSGTVNSYAAVVRCKVAAVRTIIVRYDRFGLMSAVSRVSNTCLYRLTIFFVFTVQPTALTAQEILALDDFESGLNSWTLLHPENALIHREPGQDNRVLELRPTGRFPPANERGFSRVVLKGSMNYRNVRVEGRFLFPTPGDGYLGFIYNLQQSESRIDFGVIYVKSNGNYVRVSPHYDGNPSWRLYEERRVDLKGDASMQSGKWYTFRIDILECLAKLYLANLDQPVLEFDLFANEFGAIGFEARPGRGEPVWIDDIQVSQLPPATGQNPHRVSPQNQLFGWQSQGMMPEPSRDYTLLPHLPESDWHDFEPDARGALITGMQTQSASGKASFAYVRAKFQAEQKSQNGWLSLSTANRLDIWINGYYRGTVDSNRFIWADHATSETNAGARIPFTPVPGVNDLLIRVHGNRFAGGGFFTDVHLVAGADSH